MAEFDSVDAPGAFTKRVGLTDNSDPDVDGSTPIMCSSNDGTDRYLLYSSLEKGEDLYIDKNGGLDAEILDGVTINSISCNVYDRSGKKLAHVYDDGGTIKYNEVNLPFPDHIMRVPFVRRAAVPGRGGDFREGTLGAMGISR